MKYHWYRVRGRAQITDPMWFANPFIDLDIEVRVHESVPDQARARVAASEALALTVAECGLRAWWLSTPTIEEVRAPAELAERAA
ncbi:MAG: hypothetical protein OHK0022_27660 [Roseiflexaceae bacterium]